MKVTALLTPSFHDTTRRVADWLSHNRMEALFLSLPEEMSKFLEPLAKNETTRGEFWQSYRFLTGLQEPFVRAAIRRLDSVLDILPEKLEENPDLHLHCYVDLKTEIRETKISEELILHEFRGRATGRVQVSRWRELFSRELEVTKESTEGSLDRIAADASEHKQSTVVYGGAGGELKKNLEKQGFKVELVYLKKYWRPPLDVLRHLIWLKGLEKVTDDEIREWVEKHLDYLDIILRSASAEEAYARWSESQGISSSRREENPPN